MHIYTLIYMHKMHLIYIHLYTCQYINVYRNTFIDIPTSHIYIVIYRALTARFEFYRFLFKVIKKVTKSSSKPLQKRNLLMQQGSQII